VRAVFLTAGLVAVVSLATGCSSKCESVCSDANACKVDERPVDVDCPEFCADVDSFNERAKAAGKDSCDAQFQAHLACWEQNSAKICDAKFEGCMEAAQAWTDCMTPYCEFVADENTTDPNCADGEPTLAPF
jgi:hypothetical protein